MCIMYRYRNVGIAGDILLNCTFFATAMLEKWRYFHKSSLVSRSILILFCVFIFVALSNGNNSFTHNGLVVQSLESRCGKGGMEE